MQIGERLRAARREREMSLSDLARATHLSKGFISQVESGLSSPSLHSLRKLAGALGFAPGAFLDDASQGGRTLPTTAAGLTRVGQGASAGTEEISLYSPRTLGRSARNGVLYIVAQGEQGTAAFVTLSPGEMLEASEALGAISGSVLCAVMLGSVRIRRGNAVTVARQAEVALFSPERGYQVANAGATEATCFLTLPAGCPLPVRVRVGDAGSQAQAPTLTRSTGPLRLVEMRASRGFSGQRGR